MSEKPSAAAMRAKIAALEEDVRQMAEQAVESRTRADEAERVARSLSEKLREKINDNAILASGSQPAAPPQGMKVQSQGFLWYTTRNEGWDDGISLVDEGAPGKAGHMPLVMDQFKQFHGKEVCITIEELTAAAPQSKEGA